MARTLLPILAGLVVVLAGGALHGYWTLRWYASPALEAARARLADVPGNVGAWKAEPLELPQEQLVQAGAVAWKLQKYTAPESEAPISTILLVGRPGSMTIHQPEHCYPGAGYELKGAKMQTTIRSRSGEPLGEFYTASFERQTPSGANTLRIFWAWHGSQGWRAPGNPRWELASEPALFKLYVIREEIQHYDLARIENDPSYLFLQELLPRLNATLAP